MTLVGPGLSTGPPSPDTVTVDLPFMGCGFFGSADNRAYVDGLAAGLRIDPAFPSEGDNAACVAREFVGTVTPKALDAAGISAMSLRAGNVFALGLDEAAITALIDAFEACGQPAVDLIIHMLGLNMPVAPDEATCMRATMDPLVARDFLVSGIAMGMEALTLDSPSTRGLIEVMSGCGVGSGGPLEPGSTPPRRA
jgi:hypothetical protein